MAVKPSSPPSCKGLVRVPDRKGMGLEHKLINILELTQRQPTLAFGRLPQLIDVGGAS